MNDPYKILGVSPSSTEKEINDSYRQLMAEINTEKDLEPSADFSDRIKELNNAYDTIMDMRKSDFSQQTTYTNNTSSQFPEIRELIRNGHLDAAETKLQSFQIRNAEWHFLMGTIDYTKGHLNQAYNYFAKAVQMNPNNPEYNAAFSRMSNAKKGNMPGDEPYRTDVNSPNSCGLCNICNGLICADCCCECFGGDLIPCC